MPEAPGPDDTPWWHEGSGSEPDDGDAGNDRPAGFDASEAAAQAARVADAVLRQARLAGWQETVAGGMGLLGAFLRAAAEGSRDDEDDTSWQDTRPEAKGASPSSHVEGDLMEWDDTGVAADAGEGQPADAPSPAGRRERPAPDGGGRTGRDDDTARDNGIPPQVAEWLDAGTVAAVAQLSAARDHVRTGECRSCPVCRGLALLRETNPDVVDGIGDALDTIVAILGGPSRPDSD